MGRGSYVSMVPVSSGKGTGCKSQTKQTERERNRPHHHFGHAQETLAALAVIASAGGLWWFDLVVSPVILGSISGVAVLVALVLAYESAHYTRIISDTALDVDAYMGETPNLTSRVYVSLSHRMSGGSIKKSDPIELAATPSPYMPGLKLTSRLGNDDNDDSAKAVDMDPAEPTVIVGSIRMGFGHHRIARAAASWGVGLGVDTYFHDLLAIDSPEADLIKNADNLYSIFSRLATELGGPIEKAWGAATLAGGADSLRQSWLMGEALTPLWETMPKDTPVVTSHSLVGMSAVAAGFKHVVNCVIDNHPQWFVVVPGAVNLVQGPGNYQHLLKLGVPASEVRLAGHWCPKDLVDNVEEDTAARLERADKGAPRRLLLPIGGAGAQLAFVSGLVKGMKDHLHDGRVQLYLNTGDKAPNHEAFTKVLNKLDVEYVRVEEYDHLLKILKDPDSVKAPVVFLAFKEYFPALSCTDMLARICDVMVVKPSELAFYCIPKISIRRVGDHEQFSAVRSKEVGDGTVEARTVEDALRWVDLLTEGPDLFVSMCNCVLNNHSIGMYNGSRVAIETARKMARGEPY